MAELTRFVRVLTAAFILVALFSTRATAASITWMITGPVQTTFGQWVNVLPLGSPVSLSFTWESTTPNAAGCAPGSGLYTALSGGSLSVLGASVPFGGGAIQVNAPAGNCFPNFGSGVEAHMFYPWSPGTPAIPGLPSHFAYDEIVVDLFPADTNALGLPSILANVNSATVHVQGQAGAFQFSGPVQPVPEPATLILLGSGLIAVGVAQSRRRKIPVPVQSRHRRSR
jgi:PEP-CTERM motif